MEIVTCYCLKCEEKLGRFQNRWNGIGKTYFSPEDLSYTILGTLALEAVGEVRAADPGTKIDKCILQDLACRKCKTVVGMRCERAPSGNMLKRDQLILRLKAMAVLSEKTGKRTTPNVIKTYSLQTVESPQHKALQKISGGVLSSTVLGSAKGKALADGTVDSDLREEFVKFSEWAEHAIVDQRKDIDRLDDVVGRIEKDMQSFKDFMVDVRKQFASNLRISSTSATNDVLELRQDFDGLQQQLDSLSESRPGLSNNGYEVLNQGLQKLEHRVSEVGGLKTELGSMKKRLHSLEENALESIKIYKRHKASHLARTTFDEVNREEAAAQLAQEIQLHEEPDQRNARTRPTRLIGHESAGSRTDPTRDQAALGLAQEIYRRGEKVVAKQIAGRALGKRKTDELEVVDHDLGLLQEVNKQSRRQSSLSALKPSNTTQAHSLITQPHPPSPVLGEYINTGEPRYVLDEQSGVANRNGIDNQEPLENEVRGRLRRDVPYMHSLRRRDQDGFLLTESGKVDGRSLRAKKAAADARQHTEQRGARTRAGGPTVIDLDEEDERSISAKKVMPARGSLRFSSKAEGLEERRSRQRRESRAALAKDTLERFA